MATIFGGIGDDLLIGTPLADEIFANAGNDEVSGLGGDDLIHGETGNDTLSGGVNNDTLIGGRGRDILAGDSGADVFVFTSLRDSGPRAKADAIMDLNKTEGDLIDLHEIDSRKGGGNQEFKWIGTKDFHGREGELRYFKKKGMLIVEADIKGNGKPDFQIKVDGADLHSLHASDFIL